MTTKPSIPAELPVCSTVYSVVWPHTEAFVRSIMQQSVDELLDLHRDAHTKRQDAMHEPFFDSWMKFASSVVLFPDDGLVERYPTAGSSEAIREIIRQAAWKKQDLVVFDGEYEGYEAIATDQGTRIHRIHRATWQQQLLDWQENGAPWGEAGAQWWVSQPSAIDGNVWSDFAQWLSQMEAWPKCEVWVDLTYVGRARIAQHIDLSTSSVLAGVVFSLSKVMGAYYRRIGGCISRNPVPGLLANRWFKNLDSLYLGQKWLEQVDCAKKEGGKYAKEQLSAMRAAIDQLRGTPWEIDPNQWSASDVALLMHAPLPDGPGTGQAWAAAARGTGKIASRRLCLTPALTKMLSKENL